jgi:hypothetical protein
MPDSASSQEYSVNQLKILGHQSVPYLIKYLNDYRLLPSKFVFPLMDTDMPSDPRPVSTVNDVLTFILVFQTGVDIENYRYEFEVADPEDLGVNRWRKWCVSQYPSEKDICLNSINGVPEKVLPQKLPVEQNRQ